jgi:hypothetical protein
MRNNIPKILAKLDFVNWDRYFVWQGGQSIFGWIDRPQDSYKDFVLIDFPDNSKEVQFATSSKEYSGKIASILRLNNFHSECKRVEDRFDIKNCIRLAASDKQRTTGE